MTQPSPEAVEAVTRIVQQALQGVTEPLVARLDRLEQVMTEDRSQTTPTMAGMLTSGGASQAFQAVSAIGGTPSEMGAYLQQGAFLVLPVLTQ